MKTLKLALLCVFVFLTCFACAKPPQENANEKPANQTVATNTNTTAPPVETKSVAQIDAKTVYNDKCALCHGEDGKGVTKGTPNFTNKKVQQESSDGEYAAVIKNGEEAMPGFGGKLDAAEINALVAYIRKFAK